MQDRKALVEKYTLDQIVSVGATRETSKETSEAMQGHRVVARMEQPYSGNFKLLKQEGGPKEMTIEDIDTAMAELTVTKMKKVGKYSG